MNENMIFLLIIGATWNAVPGSSLLMDCCLYDKKIFVLPGGSFRFGGGYFTRAVEIHNE